MKKFRRIVVGLSLLIVMGFLGSPKPAAAQAENKSRVAGPRVVRKTDGRLEVYYRDSGPIKTNYQTSPGGPWSGWQLIADGFPMQGNPGVTLDLDGRTWLFAESLNTHELRYTSSISASGSGVFPGWTVGQGQFGPIIIYSDPAATLGSFGQVLDFASDSNGNLGGISSFDRAFLDSNFGWVEPQVIKDDSGQIYLFYVAWDRTLRYFRFPSSGATNVGGVLYSNPSPVKRSDGLFQVFILGQDRAIWTISQASNFSWGNWTSLGGTLFNNPAAVTNADGRLEVFALGQDGAIWHRKQNSANGAWASWSSLGGKLKGDPTVTMNSDGRLQVFAVGSLDSRIWYTVQTLPGGSWSAWVSMGPL